MALGSYIQFNAQVRDGTGSRVSNLGPGPVGSRVKALTRLFDPDSCSMLPSISLSKTAQSQCTVANKPVHLQNTGSVRVNPGHGSLAFRVGSGQCH